MATVGLLHPGEMGASLGRAASAASMVVWASAGRSDATKARAAGLEDVRTIGALAGLADVVLSVVPPSAALEVAAAVAAQRFRGVYVDANAVSPRAAREIDVTVQGGGAQFVDGSIVGPPYGPDTRTCLYLSGGAAAAAARAFDGSGLEVRTLGDQPGAASAMKMCYAAASKGQAALVLAVASLARAHDLAGALHEEWQASVPELESRLASAQRSAAAKGWRWVDEMEFIADTFADASLPDGFHRAAAEIFRRASAGAVDRPAPEDVLGRILSPGEPPPSELPPASLG